MSGIDSNMLERLHQQSEEIMRLRAEIERLKAALRLADKALNGECSPQDGIEACDAVRAALEGKP